MKLINKFEVKKKIISFLFTGSHFYHLINELGVLTLGVFFELKGKLLLNLNNL